MYTNWGKSLSSSLLTALHVRHLYVQDWFVVLLTGADTRARTVLRWSSRQPFIPYVLSSLHYAELDITVLTCFSSGIRAYRQARGSDLALGGPFRTEQGAPTLGFIAIDVLRPC